MRILNVVGARPNLMKMAPLVAEMARHPEIKQTLVHTGQHYDAKMSQIFFKELGLPEPDVYLGIGSGSHAEQTARVMVGMEKILLSDHYDLATVVGDVNSTLACSIAAVKLLVPVAHVEAGLRSFDRRMPEEINRVITDQISAYLFTTSRDADENLRREGIPPERIHLVGNVMIDTLMKHRARAAQLNTPHRFGLKAHQYAVLTLHRPSNVDDPQVFERLLDAVTQIQQKIPILFPAHPRTVRRIDEFGFAERLEIARNLRVIDPLGYLEFLDMMMHAKLVLTDSGGIQEETTILGIPCLTIRENTERPVTIAEGTNVLVGTNPERIVSQAQHVLEGRSGTARVPELWDGHAAERIVQVLKAKTG